jgi:hypothetical protein
VRDSLDRVNQGLEQATNLAQDFASGFISDLRAGKSAADALTDAFGNLADELINMALKSAISGIFGAFTGGAGAGLGGALVSSAVGLFHNGGFVRPIHLAPGGPVRGAGSTTSDSIPAMLSNGEFVVNAKAASRFGPMLESINSGRFAAGGFVDPKFAEAPLCGRARIVPRVSLQ